MEMNLRASFLCAFGTEYARIEHFKASRFTATL
jgi:hypothetical protein